MVVLPAPQSLKTDVANSLCDSHAPQVPRCSYVRFGQHRVQNYGCHREEQEGRDDVDHGQERSESSDEVVDHCGDAVIHRVVHAACKRLLVKIVISPSVG